MRRLISGAVDATKVKKSKKKPIVKESEEDGNDKNSGSMLNQKTFEDFNKEQPNPEDFNLKPNQKSISIPKKASKTITKRD